MLSSKANKEPGLKRAERESNNNVSSTANRYVSCFLTARFVEFLA